MSESQTSKEMWRWLGRASAAISLTLFGFAVEALRDISKDIGDLKLSLSRVTDQLTFQEQRITEHAGRLQRLEEAAFEMPRPKR